MSDSDSSGAGSGPADKMNFSSTPDSWTFINTSLPVLPAAASTSATSATSEASATSATSPTEGYLQRLAHFDEGLYNDFYSLWVALMVVNSFIFLVGTLSCQLLPIAVVWAAALGITCILSIHRWARCSTWWRCTCSASAPSRRAPPSSTPSTWR